MPYPDATGLAISDGQICLPISRHFTKQFNTQNALDTAYPTATLSSSNVLTQRFYRIQVVP